MTKPPDFDALVDALRSDLPDDADRERVRTRLLAAGIGVGAGIAAPSTAAAAASVASAANSAHVGAVGHAASMSLTAKLGVLAVVVAAGASVPIAMRAMPEKEPSAPASTRASGERIAYAATPSAPAPARVDVDVPAVPKATAALAEQAPVQVPAQTSIQTSMQARPATAKRRASLPLPAAQPTTNTAETPQPPATTAAESPSITASVPQPAVAIAATAPAPKPQASASTLHDEADLIGRALAALRANDREGARAALAAHAQRYPHGMLERERVRVARRIDSNRSEIK